MGVRLRTDIQGPSIYITPFFCLNTFKVAQHLYNVAAKHHILPVFVLKFSYVRSYCNATL
jgi:hypothetical protein